MLLTNTSTPSISHPLRLVEIGLILHSSMSKIFLALPTHDNKISVGAVNPIAKAISNHDIQLASLTSSFLTNNFNHLWCMMLEDMPEYFVMLHSDIVPETDWIDILLEEVKDYDIVSVVSPMKNDSKGVSTATFDQNRENRIRRLTIEEVNSLPKTFTKKDVNDYGISGELLFNTGCWIAKTGDWCKTFPGFEMISGIVNEKPVSLPEDWAFSLWCAKNNLKTAATSKIKLEHHGINKWTM